LLAQKYQVPFYSTSFDTETIASERHISVQMAARDLRYEWFEKIRLEQGYDYVATAHHRDDSLETMLINASRGTGISGLHGIMPKRGTIIRPMLPYSREEIEAYAQQHALGHREDSSNRSRKYLRNKIRLELLPDLKAADPQTERALLTQMQRARDAEAQLYTYVPLLRQVLLHEEGDLITIPTKELKKVAHLHTIIFELFRPYDFRMNVLEDLLRNLDAQPGKRFYSDTHEIRTDRGQLVLRKIPQSETVYYSLPESEYMVSLGGFTLESKIIAAGEWEISPEKTIAALDCHLLEFPLQVRHWRNGDRFMPLGMTRFKKLSDFFTDEKFSFHQKENTFVLVSGEDIVWVIGHRIDNRYKIRPTTRSIYQLKITT
jgi:tRNA(Ile)-lysidine synthase